jgi:hypothetical protein
MAGIFEFDILVRPAAHIDLDDVDGFWPVAVMELLSWSFLVISCQWSPVVSFSITATGSGTEVK